MKENALMNIRDTVPDVDTAVEAWKAYMKLCGKNGILNQTDYQKIWVKEKDPKTGKYVSVEREFKKKSAWQKLARAFNVDTCIVSKEFQRTKVGRINEAYYCVRASLPNGRSVESDALCSRQEKGKSNIKDHDIMAIAKTRATNRAIAELIGAGEVSSEEITPANPPKKDELKQAKEDNLIETKKVKEEESEVEPKKGAVEQEPPKLVEECIKGLSSRGMDITKDKIKICIKDRCKDEKELVLCMEWLNNNEL